MPHGYTQVEALVEILDCRSKVAVELLVAQAGDIEHPDARQKHPSVPVHRYSGLYLDLSPYANHQLIAWPKDIGRWNRYPVHRRERGGCLFKQTPAEHGQWMPCLVGHER